MEAALLEFLDKVKTSWADGNMHASETMVVVLLIAVVARSAELDFATAVILVAAVAVYIWHSTHSRTPAPAFTVPSPMQLARLRPLLDRLTQCKMTELTPQHMNFLEIMAASRKDNNIVSVCKFIICSFVAKVNCGTDLSHLSVTDGASMTKEEANAVVKTKVLAFRGAMTQCIKANFDKKERLVMLGNLRTNINSVCRTWINRLENWVKTSGDVALGATVKSVDETRCATGAGMRLRDQMYTDVGAKVGEFIEQVEKLSKPMDVAFREDTMSSAKSLMEAIVHNSILDKSQKDNLAEAMKVCDMKFKRMTEAFTVLQRTQASAEDLVNEYKLESHAINRRMASVRTDLELASSMKLRHGQGYWRMKNAPNDEQSRKLQRFWDQDQVTELFDYTSGKFECRFVSELTDTQKEVRALQSTLEQDLKQFQVDKDELKEKNLHVVVHKAEVLTLTQLFEKAQADYKSAEQAMKVSSSTLPPDQAAEVSGLLRVAEAMNGTAGRFAPCDEEIGDFAGALNDLKICLDDKAPMQIVLIYVRMLQQIATATLESNMVLLSHLGTVVVGEFLLPNVDPGEADDHTYWKGETERMGITVENVQSTFETESEAESG